MKQKQTLSENSDTTQLLLRSNKKWVLSNSI